MAVLRTIARGGKPLPLLDRPGRLVGGGLVSVAIGTAPNRRETLEGARIAIAGWLEVEPDECEMESGDR